MQALLGQKIDQSQRFLDDGTRIPVTVVHVAANPVVNIRTQEKNGYSAVQLGYGLLKKPRKSIAGISKKANLPATPKMYREVKVTDDTFPAIGDSIKVADVFKIGDIVQVTGVSKGKGWAGGVKRHGFHGGPRTHGQSDRERAPGSIGQTTTPGRVYKGKRMAGRMGHEQVTVRNLKVVEVADETMLIAGLVPGPFNTIILIQKTGEDKKFVPLYSEPVEEPKAEETASNAADAKGTDETKEPEVSEESKEEVKTVEAPVEAVSNATDAKEASADEEKVVETAVSEAKSEEVAVEEGSEETKSEDQSEEIKEKTENAS